MKKIFSTLLLLISIFLTLTACGQGSTPSSDPATTPPAAIPTRISAKPTDTTAAPAPTSTITPTATPARLASKPITSANINALSPLKSLGLGGALLYVGYSNDGKQILTVSESSICRMDAVSLDGWNCSEFPTSFPNDFIQRANLNYSQSQDGSVIPRGLGTSIAFPTDMSKIAISDGGIWDTASMSFLSNSSGGDFVALSPDGAYKLIGSHARTDTIAKTELIDAQTNSILHVFEEYLFTTSIATQNRSFSPDNSKLVLFKDNTAEIWDIASGTFIDKYVAGGKLNRVEFSPDGNYLVLVTGKTIDIFQTADHEHVFVYAAPGDIRDFTFSPDSQYLAVSSIAEQSVKVWNVADWSRKHTLTGGASKGFDGLRFSSTSRYLYASQPYQSSNSAVTSSYDIWDMADGKLKVDVAGKGDIRLAAISPDERQFTYVGEYDFYVMDMESSTTAYSSPLTNGIALAISPTNEMIASGIKGGAFALWDATTGDFIKVIGEVDTKIISYFSFQIPNQISAIVFSPDGQMVASASRDGQVRLWAIQDGSLVQQLRPASTALMNTELAFSPDGQYLTASNYVNSTAQSVTYLWSIPDGKILLQVSEGKRHFNQMWFSPDSQYLALSQYFQTTGEISRIYTVTGCRDNGNAPLAGPACEPYLDEMPPSLSLGNVNLHIQECRNSTSGVYASTYFIADSDIVALLFNACGVQIYNRNNGRMITTLFMSQPGFARSPDNTFFIMATFSGEGVRIWGIP